MSSESTIFIIDVAKSVVTSGFLDRIVTYVEHTLFLKVKKQRKTDWAGILLCNCPVTKNDHDTENVYELLPLMAPISTTAVVSGLQELQGLRERCENEKQTPQSMIQCLLVGSVILRDKFKNRKVFKQIVVFTDNMDGLDLSDEELSLIEQELDARIILVTDGSGETKSVSVKSEDVPIWDKCVQRIPGSLKFHIDDLLQAIDQSVATVKPVRVFRGDLRLGASPFSPKDAEQDHLSLCIQVEGYPATKTVSSLNRKIVAKEKDNVYREVKSVVEYSIEAEDDGETEDVTVANEFITKAYRYGTDYVVLPPTLEPQRVYRTEPGLDIRGFLDVTNMPRHYLNSESTFIVAAIKDGTRADRLAISALVDSMVKLNLLAVARYVQKHNSEVQMCVLCPLVVPRKRSSSEDQDPDVRALVLSRLPFAEDERFSDYPKLNQQNSEENAELDALMSDLVDSMEMKPASRANWCSTSQYVPIDTLESDRSTLPLPSPALDKAFAGDRLAIPAIGVHHQQQILLDYMHQVVVNGRQDFQIPELPSSISDKLRPMSTPDASLLQKLQKLLDIKPNVKPNVVALNEEEDEDFEEIPTLEALLARGRKEH
ncbi:LAMI_0G05006g1_1 [Lachancea mirantina]|uniref:ATP-dependent DNA helicase II subunit 2 n=1 Tax=Lachancea mirantina TaxID=1230905 RepID=A0A1G4K8U6_9SACH|nr:LAMI_0G05006g1_1 [Lachancea mirantina]